MYQGYQLVLTGRPRAASERLVELSGTVVSVSPLQTQKHAFSCSKIDKKHTEKSHTRCIYSHLLPVDPDLEASSNELLVDGQHGNNGRVCRPVIMHGIAV